MSFERTRSGQTNRAFFFDADYICYVEGGGGANDHAPDITFWSNVFGKLRPDLRVRCVPRGGKPILESLAKQVINQGIDNTLVAMDTDYDDLTGDKIIDRRVLYTFGHSWESDVYQAGNFRLGFAALTHCGSIPPHIDQWLSSEFEKLSRRLRFPALADYLALIAGSSVFPRKRPGGDIIVREEGSELPKVQLAIVVRRCQTANVATRPRRPAVHLCFFETLRYCFGHILELAAYLLMNATLRRYLGNKGSISRDHLRDVAIQTFSALLAYDDDPSVSYYARLCASI